MFLQITSLPTLVQLGGVVLKINAAYLEIYFQINHYIRTESHTIILAGFETFLRIVCLTDLQLLETDSVVLTTFSMEECSLIW